MHETCSFVGLVLMALMIMVVHGHAFLLGQKIGMMARVIATSAIYQKVGWSGGGRGGGRGGGESEGREGERWGKGGREVRG